MSEWESFVSVFKGPRSDVAVLPAPAFTLALAHKDVTLATGLARDLGVPMRLAGLTHADMTEALNRGWGARDSRAAMLLQQERSSVAIKVPRDALRAILDDEPLG